MATDTTTTFPNQLAALLAELNKSGPDAPSVAALAQLVKTQYADHAADVDLLLASRRAPAAAGSNWSGVATHGGMLTAGALAAFLYAYSGTINDAIFRLNLSVTLSWVLLLIVAGVGGLGGLLNAYLADTSLVLPRWQLVHGKLTFFPGFLGNIATGALTAIVTVWLATPGQAGAAPETGSTAPVATSEAAGKNLLTPAILISAFIAGFGGSRVATGQRDKNLLLAATQAALVRPSDPAASRAVSAARSAVEAFTLATGAAPNSPRSTAPAGSAAGTGPEADLLRLLDPQGLRNYFAVLLQSGKAAVLRRDGAGLPLGVLAAVQSLAAPWRDAVKDLRLMDVAGVPFDRFKESVPQPAGTDPVAFSAALANAWTAARDARTKLEQMPEDWLLKP
jgi:hypothetical protein